MTLSARLSLYGLIAALTLFSLGGLQLSLDLAEQLATARQQAKAWQSLALAAPERSATSLPADACSAPVACAFAESRSLLPLPQRPGLSTAVVEVLGSSGEALAKELQEGRLVEVGSPVRGLSF